MQIAKKLDVVSNEIFKNCLISTLRVCILASEEDEEPIICATGPHAKYMVVFDPLDGSTNIDANVTIGTIFGIYKRKSDLTQAPEVNELYQKGENQVAAGYCVYGPAT